MTFSRKFGLGQRNFGFAVAALLGAVVGGTTLPTQPNAASATVTIAPAVAASLMAATSGQHLVESRAIGDQAKLINAAMPFSSAPVLASRPFDLSNSDPLDRRRALLCMTQAVYYEAGFESLEGRRAVAQVVINRLRHPAFPKSVCGVVYQGARDPVCQFSFVCDGSLYRRPALQAWKEAEQVAAAALDGFVDRSVGAATHYHADYVAPYWAPRLAKIVQIGAHIFYRWPGGWGQPSAFSGRYAGGENIPAFDPSRYAAAPAPVIDYPPVAALTERRAVNDVGGRMDPTKGWKLSIADPSPSGGALGDMLARQEKVAPITLAADDHNIQGVQP